MLHAGLDLSRKRLDVCLLSDQGELVEELTAFPDSAGLKALAERVEADGEPIRAVIESMTGARFVHDTLEAHGWEVEIADAQKVKGLAPLAVKTDRIDARVLAVLSQRDLVPAIWLPDPRVRRERELARFRLHLIKHRSQLEEPDPLGADQLRAVPARSPTSSGWPAASCSPSLDLPEPWRGNIDASLALIDRPRGPGRRDQRAAQSKRRRASIRAVALDGAGGRLGARLHDRRRDRRDLPLSRPRPSSPATPAFAPGWCSRASLTGAGRSPSRGPATCAGRCSRRPCTRFATRPTRSATSETSAGSESSAAPRSPRSTSPAS